MGVDQPSGEGRRLDSVGDPREPVVAHVGGEIVREDLRTPGPHAPDPTAAALVLLQLSLPLPQLLLLLLLLLLSPSPSRRHVFASDLLRIHA